MFSGSWVAMASGCHQQEGGGEGESEAGCRCHGCSPRGATAAWVCSVPLYTALSASGNCSLLHPLAGDSAVLEIRTILVMSLHTPV